MSVIIKYSSFLTEVENVADNVDYKVPAPSVPPMLRGFSHDPNKSSYWKKCVVKSTGEPVRIELSGEAVDHKSAEKVISGKEESAKEVISGKEEQLRGDLYVLDKDRVEQENAKRSNRVNKVAREKTTLDKNDFFCVHLDAPAGNTQRSFDFFASRGKQKDSENPGKNYIDFYQEAEKRDDAFWKSYIAPPEDETTKIKKLPFTRYDRLTSGGLSGFGLPEWFRVVHGAVRFCTIKVRPEKFLHCKNNLAPDSGSKE